MAQENDESSKLVRLHDFKGELDDAWHDVQGAKVRDKNGDEVGTVEDLYIFEDAQAVHLLEVSGDDRRFLIPVDAVTTASEDGVDVEQDRETIVNSPEFDSEDVPDSETSRAAHEHYGYPDQLALG